MEVFSLAHRFGMTELLRACAEVLDECMNCNDVCRVLEAAEYYGQPELAAKCWDLIKESTPRCEVVCSALTQALLFRKDFVCRTLQ